MNSVVQDNCKWHAKVIHDLSASSLSVDVDNNLYR